jgi:PmbA protein
MNLDQKMKSTIKKSIDMAMNSGADSCDAIVSSGESLSLSPLNGKLDKYKISKNSILGIRVIKNKKIGLSYTESFDDDALKYVALSALENAQFSDPNEFESISIKNNSDYLFHESGALDKSTIEEKIEFTLKLESEMKKRDSRITAVPYVGLSNTIENSYYLNSLGTFTSVSDHYFSAYSSALLKENDQTSTHYAYSYAKNLHDLNLEQIIEETLTHSISWLNADSLSTGKYDVIFDLEVLSEILYSYSNYFSAKDAIDKTNPWDQKLNSKVANDEFSLLDLPKYKDAFTHYYVDSEGMLKKDLTLIENGILKSFYHNTATAKYFGVESTGHASRGARSSLGVNSTNWLINTGKTSNSDTTSGTYFEVISVMGLGSGSDSVSGDFSFGASGYLCKDGNRLKGIKEVTVAGNFNQLLLEISCIGNSLKHNESRSLFAPLIRFSNLSIAGK